MKTTATKLRRLEYGNEHIPDGQFPGWWGGYFVSFVAHGVVYEAQTEIGIRTPRAKCTVTVKDGKITVSC